jgi:RNA polymerase sigma-70 factor (ECF subfamily)
VTGTEPDADVDLVLVRLAQAGDAEAFGRLVERNRHAVHRAVAAALGSAADADDVAQEAFVTAYRKLAGYRGESSFRTWLLSIAWRKALDRRRSLARWMRLTISPDPIAEGSTDMLERLPSPQPSIDDRLAGNELHRQVTRLIRALPRKLRDALLLAVPGTFTYDEIGRMLGVPVGTVKWRVSEARRLLKEKLVAMGYAHER